MIAESAHDSNPQAALADRGSAAAVSAGGEAVLAELAELIATTPAIAGSLAAIHRHDEFVQALLELARQRGLTLDAATRAWIGEGHARNLDRCRRAAWSLSSRRGWQPFAIEFGAFGAELVWGCGVARADPPFHELTVAAVRARPLNRLFAMRTPLSESFVASLEAEALPLRGLIFHLSRCGSTLIAEALKAWPGMRVLSEPTLLDNAFTLAHAGADPQWRICRGLIAALAQPEHNDQGVDDQGLIVKLDAWHALMLEPILARLRAAWLFVYRDPLEVMVSHARQPGSHTVRGMLPEAWFGDGVEAASLSEQEYAARVLGAICAAIVPRAHAAELLNYDELPQALTTRLPAHFGLDPAAADSQRLAATLGQHAKRPYERYVDDRAAKREAADARLHAAVQRWITPHYAALEQIRRGPGA